MTDEFPKEEWWINNGKSEKKKADTQQSETSGKETSDVENRGESIKAGDMAVSHSGAHTLCWSGSHLRPKGSASSHVQHKTKLKFSVVDRVAKKPKIKVNHQMNDVIFLDSTSQAIIFKKKDHVDKMFI